MARARDTASATSSAPMPWRCASGSTNAPRARHRAVAQQRGAATTLPSSERPAGCGPRAPRCRAAPAPRGREHHLGVARIAQRGPAETRAAPAGRRRRRCAAAPLDRAAGAAAGGAEDDVVAARHARAALAGRAGLAYGPTCLRPVPRRRRCPRRRRRRRRRRATGPEVSSCSGQPPTSSSASEVSVPPRGGPRPGCGRVLRGVTARRRRRWRGPRSAGHRRRGGRHPACSTGAGRRRADPGWRLAHHGHQVDRLVRGALLHRARDAAVGLDVVHVGVALLAGPVQGRDRAGARPPRSASAPRRPGRDRAGQRLVTPGGRALTTAGGEGRPVPRPSSSRQSPTGVVGVDPAGGAAARHPAARVAGPEPRLPHGHFRATSATCSRSARTAPS